MTKLTEFLSLENIRQGVPVSCKKRALELVGKTVSEYLNKAYPSLNNEEKTLCPAECFSYLFKREKLGSTALNQGVALPHAKLPSVCITSEIDKPVAVFLQLETPIDYESSDKKEVDLIYAVMFPEKCCETYKGCLPEIAQRLVDKQLAKQLRSAESAEEIWQILKYSDNQQSNESSSKEVKA